MHRRCYDKRSTYWAYYGGRGIKVCARWHRASPDGFLNFFLDMGNPPEGTTLDRIDVDSGYERGNCRWSTATAQNKTRRKYKALDGFTTDELGAHLQKFTERDKLRVLKYMLRKPK